MQNNDNNHFTQPDKVTPYIGSDKDYFFVPGADYSPADGEQEMHKWSMANDPEYKKQYDANSVSRDDEPLEPTYFELDLIDAPLAVLGTFFGRKGMQKALGRTFEEMNEAAHSVAVGSKSNRELFDETNMQMYDDEIWESVDIDKDWNLEPLSKLNLYQRMVGKSVKFGDLLPGTHPILRGYPSLRDAEVKVVRGKGAAHYYDKDYLEKGKASPHSFEIGKDSLGDNKNITHETQHGIGVEEDLSHGAAPEMFNFRVAKGFDKFIDSPKSKKINHYIEEALLNLKGMMKPAEVLERIKKLDQSVLDKWPGGEEGMLRDLESLHSFNLYLRNSGERIGRKAANSLESKSQFLDDIPDDKWAEDLMRKHGPLSPRAKEILENTVGTDFAETVKMYDTTAYAGKEFDNFTTTTISNATKQYIEDGDPIHFAAMPKSVRQDLSDRLFSSRDIWAGDAAPKGLTSYQTPDMVKHMGFTTKIQPSDFLLMASTRDEGLYNTVKAHDFIKNIVQEVLDRKSPRIAPPTLTFEEIGDSIQVLSHEGRHRSNMLFELLGRDVEIPLDVRVLRTRRENMSQEILDKPIINQDGRHMNMTLREMLPEGFDTSGL